MWTLRSALFILPLFLAACSIPLKQNPTTSEAEIARAQAKTAETQASIDKAIETTKESKAKVDPAEIEGLVAKYNLLSTLTAQNFQELENRVGNVDQKKPTALSKLNDKNALTEKIAELTTLNNALSNQILELDKRVETRRNTAVKGDQLKVQISDVVVKKDPEFNAQSLIGSWTRGESRVVKLNENLLISDGSSEPLIVIFTETYQLVINDKLIGTFGPNRNKYELDFDAPTTDKKGTIEGSLKLRYAD